MRTLSIVSCLVVLFGVTTESSSIVAGEPTVLFARDIQPLLAKKCILCHGPDEAEGGLRLDLPDRAMAELDSGDHAIVAYQPKNSVLLNRVVSTDDDERMPPEGEPLTTKEVKLLETWIAEGAKYETHWSYLPVKKATPPSVQNEAWIRNPIDRFVLARLEQSGIAPSPEADRATLMKRLYFDLIGIPPTPAEVDAFIHDDSADAYSKVVERLLASEHFGERWGRHWLDKARYADSDGYEKDRPRNNAWRYRDWVIHAINNDLPYDEFTIQQLAGDLLPDATPEQKLATAFHRQTLTNTEGGTDQEEFRVEATFDRTETTAAVWMGLTMTCARCHSHKYDQITQQEYYQLYAFFNNANEANTEIASSRQAFADYEKQRQAYETKLTEKRDRYEAAVKQIAPDVASWTQEKESALAQSQSLKFETLKPLSVTAKSEATFVAAEDGSILVGGAVTESDTYTLVFPAPSTPITGLRIETLTDKSLGRNGPGRTAHGNFVLSEFKAYTGKKGDFKKNHQLAFVRAEADFAQDKFPPEGALSSKEKTGWAISPQMGKPHHAIFHLKDALPIAKEQFLQVVLDQQYGSNHTIGRFRISAMSGSDPLTGLPKEVASALKTKAAKRSLAQQNAIRDHVAASHPKTSALQKELFELKKQAPKSPLMPVRVMTPAKRTTKLLHRGDFLQPAEEVTANGVKVILATHPLKSRNEKTADRLDLARWFMHENHPLTARVWVNQTWAHLFGRGIVSTMNDFGVRGEQPTHPQLLDWLAHAAPRDFGWSRKTLIRTIVMSATYRQSSHHREDLAESDPTNLLLARQNRIRVEAEIIRDSHLAVSGLLSKKIGGPSVFPPLPPGVADLSYNNNFKWKTSEGENRYRRGMYTFFKRTSPHPTLISFDCPDSNTTRLNRDVSNTPLQALIMLNNDVYTEVAQAMTQRVWSEGGATDRDKMTYAMRLCISREPSQAEVDRFLKLLAAGRSYYAEHPDEAKQLTARHPIADINGKDVTHGENAAWVVALRMVLNLDEFIVRE